MLGRSTGTRQVWGQAGRSVCWSGSGSTGSMARHRHGCSWAGDWHSYSVAQAKDSPGLIWNGAPGSMGRGVGGDLRWGRSEPLRSVSALTLTLAVQAKHLLFHFSKNLSLELVFAHVMAVNTSCAGKAHKENEMSMLGYFYVWKGFCSGACTPALETLSIAQGGLS